MSGRIYRYALPGYWQTSATLRCALHWFCWSAQHLESVVPGDGDPAIGYAVQVDQVIWVDITRASQSRYYELDQFGVVSGEFYGSGGHPLAVGRYQHGLGRAPHMAWPVFDRSLTLGQGLSSAARVGLCDGYCRASPVPPNNTPIGRVFFVAGIANMVLSFRLRRETPIPGGEHGVPRSGMPGDQTPGRLGASNWRCVDPGCAWKFLKAGDDCDARRTGLQKD